MDKYRVVKEKELIQVLGRQCSPDRNRGFYIIGPSISGRLCHVASCSSRYEANKYAKELNNKGQ